MRNAVPGYFDRTVILQGLFYSASVLGILGAHEMGHYVACRRYDVAPRSLLPALPVAVGHARRW
jgi:hypothetical protein